MRPSRRQPDELRAVSLERGVVKYAEGSCFVKFGDTHVLVTATLEDRLPPWLKGQARGWITAEYGMLPRATSERTRREDRGTNGSHGWRDNDQGSSAKVVAKHAEESPALAVSGGGAGGHEPEVRIVPMWRGSA